MAPIRLTTLGRTELEGPDGVAILSVLSQPKRFALLVYVAVEGSGGLIRRDKVAALFWPERNQADARTNLRKSLHYLRQSLGPDVIVGRGDEEIGIDASLLRCDVVALLSGDDVPAEGPFLDGFHFSGAPVEWEEWLENVRGRVRAASRAATVQDAPRIPSVDSPDARDIADGVSRVHSALQPADHVAAPAVLLKPLVRWRLATILLAAVVTSALGWGLIRRDGDAQPTRYDALRLGSGAVSPGVVQRHYALPPDGSGILFRDPVGGRAGSWWKPLESLDASYLEGLDDIDGPAFSPDGEWIAFARNGQLRRRPVGGGPSVLLADSASSDFSPGIAWLPGGGILYENIDHDLMRYRSDDGSTERIATAEQVGQVFHVRALASGEGALVTGCDGVCDATTPRLSFVDLENDSVIPLRSNVWMAWPMSDGRVVTVDGAGVVSASAFDPASGTLGSPVPLLDGVRLAPVPDIAIGRDGSLLYIAGELDPYGERLVWVERDGSVEPVDVDLPAGLSVRSMSLSPDGRRLALELRDGSTTQIWIKELPTGPLSPITEGPAYARRPVWSADSKTIAFITQYEVPDSGWFSHVSTLPADASSSTRQPLLRHELPILEVAMSPDWRTAFVRTGDALHSAGNIAWTSLASSHDWTVAVAWSANEHSIAPSPDGRWLAWISEVSGRPELYVRPFPGPGPRVQVSTDGAIGPRWSHDGREIFFRSLRPEDPDGETGYMVAARVNTDGAFRVESVENLFSTNGYMRSRAFPLYDVAGDDQRFLMVTRYSPRDWRQGEVAYSRGWYWSDDIQAKLGG
jgi:Tol biopolymer transport system component